jgi:hypothetical protein
MMQRDFTNFYFLFRYFVWKYTHVVYMFIDTSVASKVRLEVCDCCVNDCCVNFEESVGMNLCTREIYARLCNEDDKRYVTNKFYCL